MLWLLHCQLHMCSHTGEHGAVRLCVPYVLLHRQLQVHSLVELHRPVFSWAAHLPLKRWLQGLRCCTAGCGGE